MAWNEPGKGQDPWGGGNKNKGGSGPPDLEQIWRRFRARFSQGGGGGNSGGQGGGGMSGPSPKLLLGLIPLALVIWLLTGFHVVQPGEKAVILQFGRYTETVGSGWHWHLPYPIERVISVDTQRIRSASTRGIMLTKDENLVEVEVALQYRVNEAMNYLFELSNPDLTVEQALRSSVREVVGTSRLNQVIQEGVQPDALSEEALENVDLKEDSGVPPESDPMQTIDDELVEAIKRQQEGYPDIEERSRAQLPENISSILQSTLNEYDVGVSVLAVNVQYAQPPEPVQSAFEEAIKAREAEERKKNIARAYAREILARAEGQEASILLQARGYRASKVARAEGEASRFSLLLAQYEDAPQVTRQRLYLETMGEVLAGSNLVLAEEGDGGPLLYLPLQEMLKSGERNRGAEKAANQGPGTMSNTGESSDTAGASENTERSNDLRSRDRSS